VGLFAAAGLGRETLLLVPGAVALAALIDRRWLARREVSLLCVAPAIWLIWAQVVRWRIGGSAQSVGAEHVTVPFAGLLAAMGGWGRDDWGWFLFIAVTAIGALVHRGSLEVRMVVALHVAFGACVGSLVWKRWEDFSRPLLPLTIFALLALLQKRSSLDSDEHLAPSRSLLVSGVRS
jgi:hypothetical protein